MNTVHRDLFMIWAGKHAAINPEHMRTCTRAWEAEVALFASRIIRSARALHTTDTESAGLADMMRFAEESAAILGMTLQYAHRGQGYSVQAIAENGSNITVPIQ